MKTFKLPLIPGLMQWKNQPLEWEIGIDQTLKITAGENSDWFSDPAKNCPQVNAPTALFVPPDKNFIVSTKVLVNFASDFDAGAILIHERDDIWAKLCFEYSPQQQPMIVSVVTRETSDDCSAVIIEEREVYLRIAVTPMAIAFHYSLNGSYWQFVRYFSLGIMKNLRVGFSSQAPVGKQCTVYFSEFCYRAGELNNKRSGE